MSDLLPILLGASAAAFGLALLSAIAGFGGGVLLLPVFTALFGLRTAVPMLTLTQLSSNGSRVVLNRGELRWPLIGWFVLGAVPAGLGEFRGLRSPCRGNPPSDTTPDPGSRLSAPSGFRETL